mmetsp:Transcript_32614/g.84228  ORF Transcript_32614/g.84228 Transcript_32614/m.84228 type:complete len:247 (-) Transcript_32614:729-1469(-)|eukprot:CAMPEP_0113882998 /NCGR_PEP_ID=MMETSP0780_2-20120614/9310_1 /TAXON_ID=652834 /ORGANISM="Palpitomonas bilix" /LENGTH=246 /DNA_ID=CAMNT_0000870163 /DNA_START=146 /DNA_END=886 /DNA_ORIENTATION=- /assembly_acc=CAM_ASM_000599
MKKRKNDEVSEIKSEQVKPIVGMTKQAQTSKEAQSRAAADVVVDTVIGGVKRIPSRSEDEDEDEQKKDKSFKRKKRMLKVIGVMPAIHVITNIVKAEGPNRLFIDGSAPVVQFALNVLLKFVKTQVISQQYRIKQVEGCLVVEYVYETLRQIGICEGTLPLIFKDQFNWKRWIRGAADRIPQLIAIESYKKEQERRFRLSIKPLGEVNPSMLDEQELAAYKYLSSPGGTHFPLYPGSSDDEEGGEE